MPNYAVSTGLHSIQFPKSLIMMCFKILLALLQSAIHWREVGTENESTSKSVCVVFFVSVCVGVCVIVRMTQTQCVSETE